MRLAALHCDDETVQGSLEDRLTAALNRRTEIFVMKAYASAMIKWKWREPDVRTGPEGGSGASRRNHDQTPDEAETRSEPTPPHCPRTMPARAGPRMRSGRVLIRHCGDAHGHGPE